jgi:hypothetical protein
MLAQVDSEDNQYLLLLQEITNHKKDNIVIPISEGIVHGTKGQSTPKHMMRGWFLLVWWHDGSVRWEKLNVLKASKPVEVAKYAIVNQLVKELTFK